ncbi:hypothetical protein D3C81_1185020 [compost metagenome]
MLRSGRVGQLDGRAVLPGIGPVYDGWRGDIGPLAASFGRIDAETAVARGNHGGVGLAIVCESHHQLRHAQGQGLVYIRVPGMPGLAIRGDEFLHQGLLGHGGNAGGDQLA